MEFERTGIWACTAVEFDGFIGLGDILNFYLEYNSNKP
jgi:hypothetical protein